MENERLKFVQGFIGKQFTGSPSPFAHWLKGKLILVEETAVVFQFQVRKEMTNPIGMLHGGVIAAMVDDCMGVTFFILGLEYFYPTINLNVEFFNPASEGENIIVKTQVIKRGKTVINLKADVTNENNMKLVAQATSNLVVSNIKILS
jgi:uncharacterized protein (TIGR00369 family)